MTARRSLRLLTLVLLAAAPAVAQRAEVPIKRVTLSNGDRRYSVTVTVDGQPVEAGLDTGSTGLRILAASLPGSSGARGETVRISYGSGVEFTGAAVPVQLALGMLPAAKARVQRIDTVACTARVPDCAAREKVEAADYRIQGDGLPGEGFVAILGIGMRADPVGNPLAALGVRRWIVELPRPGDSGPGRLILNPDETEVARYRQFRFVGDTNQVAGCIVAAAPKTKLCAPAMIDTGAVGLRVQGGTADQILPNGTAAEIIVGDDRATASMPVTIGRRDQATAMRLYPARRPGEVSLSFGIAPYFHWSILYDAEQRRFGLADR